ncbi:hypothetical protein [Nocardia rhamnosiphila]|uniref:Uncharacterized protein n=1 Tax=Nocardia rhamnosiphila TaxID=426716 RepID=A0ABV2WYX0_9NOCA
MTTALQATPIAAPATDMIVIDGNLISGRPLDHLPAFCQAVVQHFAKTRAGAS